MRVFVEASFRQEDPFKLTIDNEEFDEDYEEEDNEYEVDEDDDE